MITFARLRAISSKIATWGIRGVVDYLLRLIRNARLRHYFLSNARKFPMTPQRGITIIAGMSSQASLSKTIRDILTALKRLGIPYQTFNLDVHGCTIPSDDINGLLTPRNDFKILKYDHVLEMFSSPLPREIPIKRSRIVFWEFDSGLLEYYPALENDDEMIGMSNFNVEVFKRLLPNTTPVRKLLYPFLFDIGNVPDLDTMRKKYKIPAESFVVFFNFDFGSSFNRKNPDGALRAFAKALKGVPGTYLIFKTKGAKSHPKEFNELLNLASELGVAEQVRTINDYIPQRDLYGLTNACDIYLSLHRGEGFGLGIAEAMSLGKAVVVTDYSAPAEFCNCKNSIPVHCRLVDVPASMHDHACYLHVKRWAEPDLDAAATAIRKLYDSPMLREELGHKAKSFIQEHFSDENFRKSINAFLDS